MFSTSRSVHSNGMSSATSRLRGFPFTLSLLIVPPVTQVANTKRVRSHRNPGSEAIGRWCRCQSQSARAIHSYYRHDTLLLVSFPLLITYYLFSIAITLYHIHND